MSEQLHPSTAPIRAEDLPEVWIEAVRSAIQRDKLPVRVFSPDRIEVYSERSKEWHPLSPVFVSVEELTIVLRKITAQK